MLAAGLAAEFRAAATQVMGCQLPSEVARAYWTTSCQIAFSSEMNSPVTRSVLFTGRKTLPSVIVAAAIHVSTADARRHRLDSRLLFECYKPRFLHIVCTA